MSDFDLTLLAHRADHFHRTVVDRTRRVYDRLAAVYPASTFFFHSKAHKAALQMSGLQDGMRVLEMATGSGEMFRRLVRANPSGVTLGFDLSPNMAAHTLRRVRSEFPSARTLLQAVDARHMPFPTESFDAVVCCFLLELLSTEDIRRTLSEVRRVLRPGCNFTLVLIGENTELFNRAYRLGGKLAPAFWGRQVEHRVPEWIGASGLTITADRRLRQGYYPARILVARKDS
jgi:ubiquinone/menaquinone biosynthesis C-methylase UbiE